MSLHDVLAVILGSGAVAVVGLLWVLFLMVSVLAWKELRK